MTADTSNFRWSDAWLFLAIGYSNEKGESSLARVIGVADAIQHAVLTWEEVDGGLFRLGKAGYVTVRDGKVSLTQQGRRFSKDYTRRQCSTGKTSSLWLSELRRGLRTIPLAHATPINHRLLVGKNSRRQ
jgi:hypothetical protein